MMLISSSTFESMAKNGLKNVASFGQCFCSNIEPKLNWEWIIVIY